MFKNNKDFEIVKQGLEVILKINYLSKTEFPSVEDSKIVMRDVVKRLSQNSSVTKVVLVHNKNYEYDFNNINLLKEIAFLYYKFSKEKDLFTKSETVFHSENCTKLLFQRYSFIQNLIIKDLPGDPIGAYVILKRKLRDYKFDKSYKDENCIEIDNKYESVLNYLINELEKTKLINLVKDNISGFKVGEREIYKKIFSPNIKPNFIYTTLLKRFPKNAKLLETYYVNDAEINIFSLEDEANNFYHVTPVDFNLTDKQYSILNLAKEVISEHQPSSNDYIDMERLREVFLNISKDLITEIAEFKKIKLKLSDINKLSNILIRHTIGFSLIEILLADENIQDISVNSPPNKSPIFITHSKYEECKTNIIPEEDEIEGWASRLRMISGKPLDSSNPILDTEIETPGARARVSAITKPLSPFGYAFSFRRHRDKPWTLPLFIKNGMITAEAAGLLSFIIDGSRTILIAGTRGSGKSSLLTSLIVEIMRKYRVITIEDTLELPTLELSKLGFNIQSMNVKSALSINKEGFSADMGIRSTLRLGDSCLIVGEVRSTEALALYEAMRVGALANTVAGTIHGDSPYGVYDRLVNDLGVNKNSFKATDLIIIANPVKSNDGLHRHRRVTQISEVRKNWTNDPVIENGFQDLFKYNPITDKLEITQELLNGDSDLLKSIGANVKEWAGNWDAIWDNITLRAKIKKTMVDYSYKFKNDNILEAEHVINANDMFHKISEKINMEFGYLDSKRIFFEWEDWFKDYVNKNFEKNE